MALGGQFVFEGQMNSAEMEGLLCIREHLFPNQFWTLTLPYTTNCSKGSRACGGCERETGREKKDAFSEELKQMETRRGRKLQKARVAKGKLTHQIVKRLVKTHF